VRELPPAPDGDGASRTGPPLWLRLLVLAVVLWLGVRVVRNVTDALTTIAGRPHPQAAGPA
jgi:hypothetical protein